MVTLFTWIPSSAPPMAAQHARLRALPPDAPDADWWTAEGDGLTYCWRHGLHFKERACWLCDHAAAERKASKPAT